MQKVSLEKKRDEQIDVLRGFAIVLVVLGHTIQYSGINHEDNIFLE
jgi:fucose 4-O-acetylase-like acetyltransferase